MPIELEKIKIEILPDGRMTAANAAKYLGYSKKTLANKRVNGTGPEFVDLGKIYYFQQTLDEYVAKSKASSTSMKKKK